MICPHLFILNLLLCFCGSQCKGEEEEGREEAFGHLCNLWVAIFLTGISWSLFRNIFNGNLLTIVQGEEPIGHWCGLEKDREGNGLDRGPVCMKSHPSKTYNLATLLHSVFHLYFELTNARFVFSLYLSAAKCRPRVKITDGESVHSKVMQRIYILSEQK